MLEWDDGAELALNPIVSDDYEYVGVERKDGDEPITVVHAPTDRKKKGTKYVIEAAIEIYKEADIIADRPNSAGTVYFPLGQWP